MLVYLLYKFSAQEKENKSMDLSPLIAPPIVPAKNMMPVVGSILAAKAYTLFLSSAQLDFETPTIFLQNGLRRGKDGAGQVGKLKPTVIIVELRQEANATNSNADEKTNTAQQTFSVDHLAMKHSV